MAMKKCNRVILYIFTFILPGLSGCMDDDMRPVSVFDTDGNGVFIACEGNFMYGNASLTYYDMQNRDVTNQAFLQANGIPLGDVAQDLLLHNGLLWVSLNNSGKLYVIDPSNFKHSGKVSGLTSPRYMLPVDDDEIWVSDLYSGHISVVNAKTFDVTHSIPLNNDGSNTHNAEEMLRYDDKVICNAWSYDNYLFFIDIESRKVTDSIETAWQPKKICLDKSGKLWVLSDGGYEGSPFGHNPASLQRIDPESGEIESTLSFADASSPTDISLNSAGDSLFLINRHVYKFPITSMDTGAHIISGKGHNFYSIKDKGDVFFLSDAGNYLDPGTVYIYNSSSIMVDSIKTGIIPVDFAIE
jgi:glutamine cyclotransferase